MDARHDRLRGRHLRLGVDRPARLRPLYLRSGLRLGQDDGCRESAGLYKPCTVAEIRDGTSNTMAFSEKIMNRNTTTYMQDYDYNGFTSSFGYDTLRSVSLPPLPDTIDPNFSSYWLFGSAHPSGLNASYLDGSVHEISYTVDAHVWMFLGVRNNQQPDTMPM